MAIDPDMEPLLAAINARLDAIEANQSGFLDTAYLAFTERLSERLLPMNAAERVQFLNSLRDEI